MESIEDIVSIVETTLVCQLIRASFTEKSVTIEICALDGNMKGSLTFCSEKELINYCDMVRMYHKRALGL